MASIQSSNKVEVVIERSKEAGPLVLSDATSSSNQSPKPRRRDRVRPSSRRQSFPEDTAAESSRDETRDYHGSDPDYEDTCPEGSQVTTRSKRKRSTGGPVSPRKPATVGTKDTKPSGKLDQPANGIDSAQSAKAKRSRKLADKDDKDKPTNEWMKELRASRAALRQLEKQIRGCEEKLESARKEAEKERIKADRFRQDHLKLLSKGKVEVESNIKIDTKCDIIFHNKSFCKAWAIPNWTDINLTTLREAFSKLSSKKSKPFATTAVLRAAEQKRIPSWVVLNAYLNRELCAETFARPFAHLRLGPAEEDNGKSESLLNRIMERAEEKSPNTKHKLRVTILRAIDPSPVEGGQLTSSTTQQEMSVERVERCKEIVSHIVAEVSMLLKDVNDEERNARESQLLHIVENAMELSHAISVQYPTVQFYFLDNLKKPEFELKKFWFKPHDVLKITTDEEAQALVGEPIDIVVAPAVVRYGDKDGENYERGQLVSQGSAWIASAELASRNIADTQSTDLLSREEERKISESRRRTELYEQIPENPAPQATKPEKEDIKKELSPDASKTPYKLRTQRRPTRKKAETEAGTIQQDGRSERSQSMVNDPEEPIPPPSSRGLLRASAQPPLLDHDAEPAESAEGRSTHPSENKDENQEQQVLTMTSRDLAACLEHGLSKSSPNGGQDSRFDRPPKRKREQARKETGAQTHRGEMTTKGEAGNAEVNSEVIDNLQAKQAAAYALLSPSRSLSTHSSTSGKSAVTRKWLSPKDALNAMEARKDMALITFSDTTNQALKSEKTAAPEGPAYRMQNQPRRLISATPGSQTGYQTPQPNRTATGKPQKTDQTQTPKNLASQLKSILDSIA
ncbi:uncharacterized protein Z519_06920 [Cladophialophora bantiana CBS 173.52]|uniref:Uncharacterized protein n=1 Tax=Cladophialophora bantiana (strain ATCC 10958 / CBS 173.52 / CDC B-1940 / NIH 8579) TaxID=1442370 RepID=A0A0D2HFC8_CLAB1|nr:uncharacterized protein Z519_06920 [Cladophialophora bantiana CBS 173.52]KIW91938.1 hypothetical protein Z519_06920 [Cladophialophora bantiana CBS 173.52]